jgi:hypothetical protein
MIPLRDWNSYLKNIYESPNVMDNIPNVSTEDDFFFYRRHKFGVKATKIPLIIGPL